MVDPRTLVSVGVALAVGVSAVGHGLGFMDGFNTTPLPELLSLAGAARSAPSGSPTQGRVVVFVVDGLRADFADHLGLPPMARCTLESVVPSFSRPAYVALSTGVPPWASGVHTNDHAGAARLPSIWETARHAGHRTHLVTDGTDWWVDLFPDGFDTVEIVPKARFAAHWAARPLPEPGSLTLVHIVAADDAAHDFGTGADYVAAISAAGAHIRSWLDALDPTRDTAFITADHGHIARGGHGGPEPETQAVPLFAFGAGAVPLEVGHGDWCGSLIDLPVAIAARLDIVPPIAGLGALPPVVRPLSAGFLAQLTTQSVAVHDQLRGTHDPLDHGRVRPASAKRVIVAAFAWLALAALVAGLVVGPRRRAIASTLIAPLAFVAAYFLVEPTLSLSAVWLRGPWSIHVALIAGAAAALSCWVVFRRHAPAEALSCVAVGAWLPVVLAIAAHGSTSAGPVLGEPHAAFAIVAADLGAGVTTAVGLAASVIAWVVDRRRAGAKVWA